LLTICEILYEITYHYSRYTEIISVRTCTNLVVGENSEYKSAEFHDSIRGRIRRSDLSSDKIQAAKEYESDNNHDNSGLGKDKTAKPTNWQFGHIFNTTVKHYFSCILIWRIWSLEISLHFKLAFCHGLL